MLTPLQVSRYYSNWILEFEVISSRSYQYLFSVHLMDLFSNETFLNAGRFEKYSHDKQENIVILISEQLSGHELKKWTTSIIEWIAKHSSEEWHLNPSTTSVGGYTNFEFSFKNQNTAVLFALVWK